MIPVTKEDFDFRTETKVLDISSDSFPLNETLVKAFLDVFEVSKVHPMDEEMEGRWVWNRKEEDGVVGGARH